METIETLKRRIQTAEDLHAIVRTMKALAAVNIRQLERAVESLVDYQGTVERGLQAMLRAGGQEWVHSRVAPRRSLGAVIFGTDQGMCGPLNDQIVAFALEHLQRIDVPPERRHVVIVGSRAAARWEDAGQNLDATLPVPGSTSGIVPRVQDLLVTMDRWFTEHHVDQVVVFYSQHVSRTSYQPRRVDLLPIDRQWLQQLQRKPWPTNNMPTFTMDANQLFSALIHEYLFVALYQAQAESMASENASRLVAMRGAERTIGDKIEELTQQFHQQRQMTITEELLDIVSGFEVLGSGDRRESDR